MTWFGELESHVIKMQYNCMSDSKTYSNNNFIPIVHEHLLVFRKNKIWLFETKITTTVKNNIINATNITWRDLIQATIEYLKNSATIDEIYNILSKSKKAENNHHIREKIRQTLNTNSNFKKIADKWTLCLE